jgi:hypothetical protein
MGTTNEKSLILETTALQIVSVVAWLWIVPIIDSFDSYSYGMATRALIISFIPFVVGVIVAVAFPNFTTRRRSRSALITGCILLAITLVFYVIIYQELYWGWWLLTDFVFLRTLGFALVGYALQTIGTGKQLTFKTGLMILIVLYIIYNLLIWGMNNVPCHYMPLYRLANIAYALVRIAIVLVLWKTLSADSVTLFLSKFPQISLLVAGLFWGMFLVMPANTYSPRWLAILMLFMAPVVAYIMTVIVRFSVRLIIYVVKGVLTNRFWWLKSCCWWIKDESNEREIE